MRLPISVVILSYNEEKNIEDCIRSAYNLADEIFIVDSYSADMTLDIAKKYTNKIYFHKFEDYSLQRNWAQANLPLNNEWIFHLDADERISIELGLELRKIYMSDIKENGFMFSRKTIFMGKWIRYGGHYPNYHLRLFRKDFGHCENRKYHQHFFVLGKTKIIKGDIINIFTSDLSSMIERHNRWTSLEAEALIRAELKGQIKGNFFGNPIEKKRWLRSNIYANFPLFVRSFLYFLYRYLIRLGFLDGVEGLIFHFLQGFWSSFIIDAKIYEYRKDGNIGAKRKSMLEI